MTPVLENGYVAECFWAGVTEDDLRALDERVSARVADLASMGQNVRYLGSILMRTDEVVLCRFRGSEAAVQRAAERAKVPFERLVETAETTRSAPSSATLRAPAGAPKLQALPHRQVGERS